MALLLSELQPKHALMFCCRAVRTFVIIYSLALHALVFWVMARWSHNNAHNTQMGAAELALMCQRMSEALPG